MIATTVMCMALALHIEARGEPLKGKLAVASVIMNRVQRNDSDVCTEITKPAQFPWARKKIKKVNNDYVISEKAVPKDNLWGTSLKLADEVLEGTHTLLPKIMSFHSIFENPKWKIKFAYKIGNHKFYYA